MENKLAVTGFQLPGLMKNAYETLEGMKQVAQMYIESRTIPDHFYEKTGGKVDYTKGKIAAVQSVLIRAYELDLKPTTALQSIIPINGLLTLRVDLMKSMIFSSGTMASRGWTEKEEGDVEAGSYKVTITGKRKDNGIEMSRSFSISQAKRAGLWITPDMLQKQDGYKKKQSAWYKYGPRMVATRAGGFLCRDLWGDVIDNSVSFEEARDYPEDTTTVINKDGTEIIIPDKQFAEDRSQSITSKAAAKIDEATAVTTPIQPAEEIAPPLLPGAEVDPELPSEFHWTEEAMKEAKAQKLYDACMQVSITKDAVQVIPGNNTNKKLRQIIMWYNANELLALVNKYRRGEGPVEPDAPAQVQQPVPEEQPSDTPTEQETVDPDNFMEPAEGDQGGDMEPNKGFDNEPKTTEETPAEQPPTPAEEESIPEDSNKHDINVPELSENNDRPFEVMSELYFAMQEKGILNEQFDPANAKLLKGKFKNMEEFCKLATVAEINLLLNSIG